MKFSYIFVLATALFLAANTSFAQHTAHATAVKPGYASVDDILMALPEAKVVETELKSYKAQLETQAKSMGEEFEKKFKDYQAKMNDFAPPVREAKEKELQALRQSMSEFEEKAQADLQKKNQTLLAPVYDKIQKAIDEIAKAEHFSHIFSPSVSGFPILIYAAEEFNITNKVILKLGGTVPPKQTPAPTTGGK